MNKMELYYHLPYPAKVLAATTHGYTLKRWRYGSETLRLVDEALERENWTDEQWRSWQEEHLAEVLTRAVRQVPYYRSQWESRRRKGDRASWEYLENWPILDKEQVYKNPRAFLMDGVQPGKLYEEHTGGTTGVPLTLWFGKKDLHFWYALMEARWRRWYGLTFDDRWANVGVQRVAPFEQTKPPFWVWNAAFNQLYVSSIHTKAEHLKSIADAMRRYKIRYLYGYPYTIYWFALHLMEAQERFPLQAVITCAEPLHSYQREAIALAFGCQVRETFGQSEKVCAASECDCGRLHIWPEGGYLELLNEFTKSPVAPGETGIMVCTRLFDSAMPLIRYNTYDLARQPAELQTCGCGRNMPVITEIVGRVTGSVLTKDGRRIGQVESIFGVHAKIKEAQVIQEELERFTIRVVPYPGWSVVDEELIREVFFRRVGKVQVDFELVDEIQRAPSGKFVTMISKV